MTFSNTIPFGDRASTGFMVLRHVPGKGGSTAYLVDGGKVYRSVEQARARANELCGKDGAAEYDFSGEYRVSRA